MMAGADMEQRFDAVIIGAGHNGLAAATTLARKGKSVCIVERSDTLGGMAGNVALMEGAEGPELAHLLYNLHPGVLRELGLSQDIEKSSVVLPSVSLSPDGRHVVLEGARARFADGTPHPQAATVADFMARLQRYAALLAQLSAHPPPDLPGGMAGLAEMARLGKLGLGLKRLGKADMREFLRILLSNIADVLLDEFEDGPLPGLLAADAVRGGFAGPRSPGTVFSLMYRLGNDGGRVRLPLGGRGALAARMAEVAKAAGCTIRTGDGVARVLLDNDKVSGVQLQSGAQIACRAVLSSAGPMQTMALAGAQHFDVEAVRRLRNLRCKGSAAKLNLVLRQAPEFPGLDHALRRARLVIAPSVAEVERSFNPAKYDELPANPSVEFVLPTLSDPGLGQTGEQVLSAIVTHVPYAPKGGWSEAARQELTDRVVGAIEAHSPGLSGLIEHATLLTPEDIERRTGAAGGHWHHAEMGFDQILTLRPANGLAGYRFAIAGLYLCGAAAHPGGDVTGAPGRNAALRALGDGVMA